MKLETILLTVTAIVLIGFAPLTASAQTEFTFTGNESVYWHVDGNWDLEFWPEAGDIAIIPSGKTCTTGDGAFVTSEAATEVQVAGTLNIGLTHTLTIEDELDVGTSGTVRMLTSFVVAATLLYDPGCVFVGNGGSVVADSPSTGMALIDGTSSGSLTIQDGVTVRGSVTIIANGLINNGLVLADASRDVLDLGTSSQGSSTVISGTGTFRVRFGTMTHRMLELGLGFNGALEVTGSGTMRFTDDEETTKSNASVDVSGGGTLDILRNFESYGGLSFNNGAIDVSVDNRATFK